MIRRLLLSVALATAAAATAAAQAPSLPPAAPVSLRARVAMPATGATQAAQTAPLRLSLADAVTRGLDFNIAIIVQEQARNTVTSQRLQALSALLPHVSGNIRASDQVLSTAAFGFSGVNGFPTLLGPFSTFDARVVVSAPVFDATAHNELAAAHADERAAGSDYHQVRSTVALAVAHLYLQAVADAARVESSRAQVATAESLVRIATDHNAAGLVARIDVVRQGVELEAARAAATRAENDLEKRKLQLARAIGLPASQTLELTDAAPFTPAQSISVDAAVADAREHRADLQRARARLEAAEATHRAATGSMLPSLRIDGDYGAIGLTFGSADRTYSIAAAVHVPIFEGGRAQARTAQADALLKQRQAELADLESGIQFEVREALLDIHAAEATVALARSGEALAREELAQAEDRFRAGIASTIEVVRAQDAVGRASEQYIASVYEHNIAKAELVSALGDAEHRYLQLIKGQE
jgi:outer membrane protein TolC